MSRKLMIMLMCMSVVFSLYAENRILFVRMADGTTDYFAFNEVDSIRYSTISIDSVAYSDVRTQEIWLQDTVCRYEITDILELGFQTPEPVLKENTIDLAGELAEYVVDATGVTVVLSDDTPASLLPKVGDKLFCELPQENIPNGFMGQVISIGSQNGMHVLQCEYITMEDLYTEYYGVQASCGDVNLAKNKSPRIASDSIPESDNGDFTYSIALDPYRVDSIVEFGSGENLDEIPVPSGGIDYNGSIEAAVDLQPYIIISRITVIKNGLTETQRTGIRIKGDYTLSLAGKIECEKRLDTDKFRLATIPLGYGFVVSLDTYLFFEVAATMGFDYSYSNYLATGIEITSKKIEEGMEITTGFRPYLDVLHKGEHSAEFSWEGEMIAGMGFVPAVRWGEVSFIKDIHDMNNRKRASLLCLEPTIEAGIRFAGNGIFTLTDMADCDKTTDLYRQLVDDSGIDIGPSLKAELYAGVLEYRAQVGKTWNPELNPWLHFNIFPKFLRPTFVDMGDGTGSITYPLIGSTGTFKKIGVMVERGDDIEYLYYDRQYLNSVVSFSEFATQFSYNKGNQVRISPFVELFPGVRVKGYPAWPFVNSTFYPFIAVQESGSEGIRATAGAIAVGSASNDVMSVQEGAPFPFNDYEPTE